MTNGWSEHELALKGRVLAGETVPAHVGKNAGHRTLLDWAEEMGLYVYVGRPMPGYMVRGNPYVRPPYDWRNPFIIDKPGKPRDGDRATVLAKHEAYLMGRPELLDRVGELKGKVLGCWCAPKPCHADLLAELAGGERKVH